MNHHLTQEDLVLSYYDDPAAAGQHTHLAACSECRAELERIASVLGKVTSIDVPEPEDGYEARVWERLDWRLRTERRRGERRQWLGWIAVAAMIALAFVGGLLVNRRDDTVAPGRQIATGTTTPTPQTATSPNQTVAHVPPQQTATVAPGPSTPQQPSGRDRILLLVVGNHFDQSERVLLELSNLTPKDGNDISAERERAEELLASNRIYRRTALDRGEGNVATLLDELEPMLLQIAHAPAQVSADELRTMQRRVETKGLVFKLRVLRADVVRTASPAANPNTPNI